MFERPHHRRIAQVLTLLDGDLLRQHSCWFGGGTAISLRFSEYRESRDIDFLVSDLAGYRELRKKLGGPSGVLSLMTPDQVIVSQPKEARIDQYGIRTWLSVDDEPIKFEIVLEARIEFEIPEPGNVICGLSTLTTTDAVASKLLANTDRGADPATLSRDAIDLALMELQKNDLRAGYEKACAAYGETIAKDLIKTIDRFEHQHGSLDRCLEKMEVTLAKALVWKHLRTLRRMATKL